MNLLFHVRHCTDGRNEVSDSEDAVGRDLSLTHLISLVESSRMDQECPSAHRYKLASFRKSIRKGNTFGEYNASDPTFLLIRTPSTCNTVTSRPTIRFEQVEMLIDEELGANLQLSCDELSIKATSLESEKDKLINQVSTLEATCFGLRDEVSGYKLFKEQIEVVQDEQVKMLSDKVAGIDADLMGMALHLDEELYPCFLTTITGRRWISFPVLETVVMKNPQPPEKAGRGLVEVAAYNPAVKANYVAVVNALRPAVESPKANQLQPSPEQLMLPIHRPEDQVVIGETSLSFSLDVIHARVQRIRGDVAAHRLSLYDAMVPLIEPLSAKNLTGETSTSRVPTTATTTALSTTFIQSSSIPPNNRWLDNEFLSWCGAAY
ncbi:hypothetical protein Tco_0008197 [Tanacetum coccineum]